MLSKKTLTILLSLFALLIFSIISYNYYTKQQDSKKLAEYEVAANTGNIDAMKKVALIYEDRADATEDYSTEDYESALEWYLKAYNAGESSAYIMFKIGNMYDLISRSENMGRYNKLYINAEKALSWYLKAYNAGDSSADIMFKVGNIYSYTDQNQQAMEWLLKAADAGSSGAMLNLGKTYFYSFNEQKKNCEKAMEWYLKSANAGNCAAMQEIAYMYREGECVNPSEEIAKQWYQKEKDAPKDPKNGCEK